jgi:putative nucleotidyltransferase with HDIG domain
MSKIDAKALRGRVELINNLPTIPMVLKRLLTIVENPTVSVGEISEFISSDPALTTRVLRMVNSPVYGFPGRISSVSQAVVLLGTNVVKGLLFGVSVFDLMQQCMIGLWEHSLGVAILSRLIAKRKGLKEPEEASVAGLLHDLGKVIFILQLPEEYQKTMDQAEARGITMAEAEKDLLDVTHAHVGSWVAQSWRFPANLVDVIYYHHRPHLAKSAPAEVAIVHLADILVRARGFGFAGDRFMPSVNQAAWKSLSLSEEDLKEILQEMEGSLEASEELVL